MSDYQTFGLGRYYDTKTCDDSQRYYLDADIRKIIVGQIKERYPDLNERIKSIIKPMVLVVCKSCFDG